MKINELKRNEEGKIFTTSARQFFLENHDMLLDFQSDNPSDTITDEDFNILLDYTTHQERLMGELKND